MAKAVIGPSIWDVADGNPEVELGRIEKYMDETLCREPVSRPKCCPQY